MHQFIDSKKRRWSIEASGYALKRVLKLAGVNLTELDEGRPPLVQRLSTDMVLQVDVLYAILQPDIEAAELSDEQWGKELGPQGHLDGVEALRNELIDFFQKMGRTDLVAVLKAQMEFGQKLITRKSLLLSGIDSDALIEKTMPLPKPKPLTEEAILDPSGTNSTNTPPS